MLQKIIILQAALLLLCNVSAVHAFSDNSSKGTVYIESIAESDNNSELYGFHFVAYMHDQAGPLDSYLGGGVVRASLSEHNESFIALHMIAGLDYMLTKNLGVNLELGFDLGEELISGEDEKGTPTVGGVTNNQVDFNFAAGVVFNLNKSMYIKTYVRQHYFDGVYLPDTSVTFAGVRAGFSF